mmetsp:Transcript_25692/g.65299  ORF Transcript_25692/g.65299 Transcript_25692/m.65299 type:complete len:249 (-) Transcript_25692:340-1086(-)
MVHRVQVTLLRRAQQRQVDDTRHLLVHMRFEPRFATIGVVSRYCEQPHLLAASAGELGAGGGEGERLDGALERWRLREQPAVPRPQRNLLVAPSCGEEVSRRRELHGIYGRIALQGRLELAGLCVPNGDTPIPAARRQDRRVDHRLVRALPHGRREGESEHILIVKQRLQLRAIRSVPDADVLVHAPRGEPQPVHRERQRVHRPFMRQRVPLVIRRKVPQVYSCGRATGSQHLALARERDGLDPAVKR